MVKGTIYINGEEAEERNETEKSDITSEVKKEEVKEKERFSP